MAPELVAGGGYGGLIREKPYCAVGRGLIAAQISINAPKIMGKKLYSFHAYSKYVHVNV